jgi:fatty-acyl-CoA synthase
MSGAPGFAEAITLGDVLLRAAAERPDEPAAVYPHERATWAQLAERSRAVARGLIALGVRRGEHVGVMMSNGLNAMSAIYGIALAGAVVVPINLRYRAVEIPFVVENGDLVAILTSDESDGYVDLLGLLAQALPGLAEASDARALEISVAPRLRSVVVLGARRTPGTVRADAFAHGAAAVDAAELDRRRAGTRLRASALVLYTSGTTALPRGCVLTHEAIVRCWIEVGRVFGLGPSDRVWAPCPLFHMGAVGPMIMCAAHRACFISDTYFEPDRALELLAAERPTILYSAYPPITQAVLTHPRFAATDMSAGRAMLNVGPPDLLRQMQASLPHVTQLSLYGLTEGGGAVTYNHLDDELEVRVATTGTPLPGSEVRIVDPDTGAVLGPGAVGEISIRGVTLCERYHRDPEKTAAVFDDEGWLSTGDQGELDPAGRLVFLGRLKDMLKVGGENVAPAEVEEHLGRHPAVKLVVVVGAPDERLGEVPVAFVELLPDTVASAEELLEHCHGQIARFKIPRYVRFVTEDEWPMSATKIQKYKLREELEAELKGAAA